MTEGATHAAPDVTQHRTPRSTDAATCGGPPGRVGAGGYPDAVTADLPTPPAAATAPTGVLISFEGGDGVGKSTQLSLLAEWLTAQGCRVVTTREPGGTPAGVELRQVVMHGDHVAPRAEALIYAADRAHHVATLVRPALADGAVVLTDRYLDSSVAYQGTGRELGAAEVERLNLWAVEGLLPHLTILLDLDPAVGLSRLTGAPARLERAGAQFHERTRAAFLERAAADPGRWLVLDAARPVDDVAADVRRRVSELLARLEVPAAP